MRIRSLVTIALLLPSVASAQRRIGGGRIGSTRPAPPAALPPTAGPIAREMSYVPRPYSVESYMFISYMRQPMAPTNALTNYGTMNAGTRLDYRLNDFFSITGDLTSSLFYGQASNGTAELGTRFLPMSRISESRLLPYMDLRLGYMYSYQSYVFSSDPAAVNPLMLRGAQYGTGLGTIGGVGADFRITRSLYLATALLGSRTRMNAATSTQGYGQPADHSTYWQTGYRLALGVRFNPMKAVPTYEP